MSYQVNEIFYSVQGEGVRAGVPSVFVRLSGCNQTCSVASHGFDCDTEFVSGRKMTEREIVDEAAHIAPKCRDVIFTGGEPGLQLNKALIHTFRDRGYYLIIETNGSINVDAFELDWITVSPKVAEHAIAQKTATEVKYVRGYGQGIPKTVVAAQHKLISPAFDGQTLDPRTLNWCINLVKENPEWRLSLQQHKFLQVR